MSYQALDHNLTGRWTMCYLAMDHLLPGPFVQGFADSVRCVK